MRDREVERSRIMPRAEERRARWPAVVIALATGLTLATFLGVAAQPGCSASPCKATALSGGAPVSSIQCPSGQLCYEGQCRKSCNAGEERATQCTSNNDCKDNARPNCLSAGMSSFCSSCATSESCIPRLNICQPVAEIPLPPDPTPMVVIVPPALDGGPIDAVSLARDSGPMMMPPPQSITHRGSIVLKQSTDFRTDPNAMERPEVEIDFTDVRMATLSSRRTNVLRLRQCALDRLDVYTSTAAPSPANLGEVRLENDRRLSPPALTATITASFNPASRRYRVVTPATLPPRLLNLSMDRDSRVLQIIGGGQPGLIARWPDPAPPAGYHIPFRLDPLPATLRLLRDPIVLSSPPDPPQDLVFGWTALRMGTHIMGEKVIVELTGQRFGIRCEEEEGTSESRTDITIPSALISTFVLLERIPRDGTVALPISFERAYDQQVSVPPDGSAMVVVFTSIHISHAFYGQVRF